MSGHYAGNSFSRIPIASFVLAVLGSTTAVHAQQANPAAAETSVQEVVITGSRLRLNGYDQPTPVTVVTSQALLTTDPGSLADGLNQLPQFSLPRNRTFCCEVGSQGNYLNLRGLGTTRTLVLLDSRRIVASRESGDVDVNLLPELLIQRIDVVTGGASAAYGSDAVSGVVNYVIDNNFEGVKANAQYGISNYSDDKSPKFGIAAGSAFGAGRGHVVASIEYAKAGGIESLADRPQSRRGALLGGNGTAAAPFITLEGVRQNTATPDGLIVNAGNLPIANAGAPLAGLRFLPGGGTTPFVFGTPIAGAPNFSIGGDGFQNNLAQPAASLETKRFYLHTSYELTDSITAKLRLMAGESDTAARILADNRSTTQSYTIFRDNAYLPAAVAARMDAAGVTSFRFARFNRDFGAIENNFNNRSWDINAGLDGKFAERWNWSASIGHGETRLRADVDNVGNISNIYAQADAVRDPSGNIVCRVTLTNAALYPGCVPANLFGEGSPSQAARDYALDTSSQSVKNTQDIVNADVHGNLFSMPAGEVATALGVEYRRRSLREVSNAVALGQILATGIRGVPGALCPTAQTCRFGGWQQGNFGEADANDDVKEGFVEALVPLLKDLPLAHALDLNAALRYTDYKNSGGVTTWKAGLSYAPVESLRFRTTKSRDIRAPNLFELFAGPVNAFTPGLTDALTGQTNLIAITRTQGNPNLKPEKADNFTLGVVYTPTWFEGFSGAVDYYDISIDGALGATAAQATLDQCAGGNADACALISRDPVTRNIQQIILQQVNINSRVARGVDFDLTFARPLAGGKLGVRALASRTLDFIDTAGGIKTQQAGYYNTGNQLTLPKWRGSVTATYDVGAFGFLVRGRYIGSYEQLPPIPGQLFASPTIGSLTYTDISVNWKVPVSSSAIEAYVTVNNVFDRLPPFVGNRFAAGLGFPTPPNLYDLDDRFVTAGVNVKF
jgi:outer membrane receptor protein involved in Fe transport